MFPAKRAERGFDSSQTLDAAFHDGSVDQFWQSHMLEVHDSMGSNPIGTTNPGVVQLAGDAGFKLRSVWVRVPPPGPICIIDCVWKTMLFLISSTEGFPLTVIGLTETATSSR